MPTYLRPTHQNEMISGESASPLIEDPVRGTAYLPAAVAAEPVRDPQLMPTGAALQADILSRSPNTLTSGEMVQSGEFLPDPVQTIPDGQ